LRIIKRHKYKHTNSKLDDLKAKLLYLKYNPIPPEKKTTCNGCNTLLESYDHIMNTFGDPMSDGLCGFCYAEV